MAPQIVVVPGDVLCAHAIFRVNEAFRQIHKSIQAAVMHPLETGIACELLARCCEVLQIMIEGDDLEDLARLQQRLGEGFKGANDCPLDALGIDQPGDFGRYALIVEE